MEKLWEELVHPDGTRTQCWRIRVSEDLYRFEIRHGVGGPSPSTVSYAKPPEAVAEMDWLRAKKHMDPALWAQVEMRPLLESEEAISARSSLRERTEQRGKKWAAYKQLHKAKYGDDDGTRFTGKAKRPLVIDGVKIGLMKG